MDTLESGLARSGSDRADQTDSDRPFPKNILDFAKKRFHTSFGGADQTRPSRLPDPRVTGRGTAPAPQTRPTRPTGGRNRIRRRTIDPDQVWSV